MKRAKGADRELYSENFSKELFFAVNSPPMHILEESFIPDLAEELRRSGKTFMRKDHRFERLVGGESGVSASTFNQRARQEQSGRLPLTAFKR